MMSPVRPSPLVGSLAFTIAITIAVGLLTSCGEDAPAPPTTTTRRDAGPPRDAHVEGCVSVVTRPTISVRANDLVDVIVVVDNSRSMREEAEQVRRGINTFAETLGASGLDYHVILISDVGEEDTSICVPAPLGEGAPGCGAGEGGRLRVVDAVVGSTDAPEIVIAQYAAYADFLREGSVRAFLWVTDDDALASADWVRQMLAYVEPETGFGLTVHHAIVGYYGGDSPSVWRDRSAGSCGSLASVGLAYLRLAQCYSDRDAEIPDCTRGTLARICDTDWTRTFEEIARRTEVIAIDSPLSCTLRPPPAPEGRVLDYGRLEVAYQSGDETTVLRRASTTRCEGGWRLDDDRNPTAIVLCEDACRSLQADIDAVLTVTIACDDDPT